MELFSPDAEKRYEMSIDNPPQCPGCGEDLIFAPEPEYSHRRIMKEDLGDWQCPECREWYDIPDYDPEPEEEKEKEK